MKKITGNESAMPHEDLTIGREFYESEIGLTIHQQFSMAAMQGLLSNETSILRKPSEIATMAVLASYALINELNK